MIMLYLTLIDNQSDREKFEKIYEEQYMPMYHTAFLILHDADLAEDAVHNAFLNLAQYFHRVDFERNISSFMHTIVRNCALSILRKEKRVQYISDEDLNRYFKPMSVEEQYEYKAKVNSVAEYIAGLPEEYAILFTLRFRYGYKTKEIADIMGLSDDVVRKRISRMKQSVEFLKSQWED